MYPYFKVKIYCKLFTMLHIDAFNFFFVLFVRCHMLFVFVPHVVTQNEIKIST